MGQIFEFFKPGNSVLVNWPAFTLKSIRIVLLRFFKTTIKSINESRIIVILGIAFVINLFTNKIQIEGIFGKLIKIAEVGFLITLFNRLFLGNWTQNAETTNQAISSIISIGAFDWLRYLLKNYTSIQLNHIGVYVGLLLDLFSVIFKKALAKLFVKHMLNASKTGKELASLSSKQGFYKGKLLNLIGFSLGSLVTFEYAVCLGKKGILNKIGDLYLLGSVVDKTTFLNKIHYLIGPKGSIQGRIFISTSKIDLVLGFIMNIALLSDGKQSMKPIGNFGVDHREIADHLFIQLKYHEFDRETLLKYCFNKVQILDVTNELAFHSNYKNIYGKIMKRYA